MKPQLNREQVERIINKEFSVIENDGELTLLLLYVYSKLFLEGGQPTTCGKCMRNYYTKISQKGIKLIEFMEAKTNVLKPGIYQVSIPGVGVQHYSASKLSDELAIKFLHEGRLKVDNFIVLPKEYSKLKIELEEKNKALFTNENLNEWDAESIKVFAELLTEIRPANKAEAVKMIIEWTKA